MWQQGKWKLIAGLLCAFSISARILYAGDKILELPLNETPIVSGTTLTDISGNGNNGLFQGSAVDKSTAGRVGTAVALDGAADYINIANSASLSSITATFSVESWVNPSINSANTDAMQMVIGKWGLNAALGGANFSVYDAGTTGGLTTKGYVGAVFDGRYVYFAPYNSGYPVEALHGRILRYDTRGAGFNNAAAWSAYDAGVTSGLVTKGYVGGVFDGRYVYFVPNYDGATCHGRVLRYDTQGAGFTNTTSWFAYDAGATGGLVTVGYAGGVFDGRYVYFIPNSDNTTKHGRVLCYDTQGAGFASAAAWSAYDAGNTAGLVTKGYSGGTFDGRYVYFTPSFDGIGRHGKVLRYDTQGGGFTNIAAWSAYDAGATGGLVTKGYQGCVYDGRYLYFVPYRDDTAYHGKVLRYDTQGAGFTNAAAWSAYDAGATGGLATKGYFGGIFDGRYVYFLPWETNNVRHALFLRYDTRGAGFNNAAAWSSFDAGATGGLTTKGYLAGVFDGRFIYLAPDFDNTAYHGKVLRYDTAGSNASFCLKYAETGHQGGYSGALPGPSFTINTPGAATMLAGYNRAMLTANAWHHLVGTYDGNQVRLYVDGVLAGTAAAFGNLAVNTTAVNVGRVSADGAYFAGSVDHCRIYNRALLADEVLARYLNPPDPVKWVQTANWTSIVKAANRVTMGDNIAVISFTAAVSGTATAHWKRFRIDETGGQPIEKLSVSVYEESGNDGFFDAGDRFIASGTFNSSRTCYLNMNRWPIGTTAKTYYIVEKVASDAAGGVTIRLNVADGSWLEFEECTAVGVPP